MNASVAVATAVRVLRQLRRDLRTVALVLVVPLVLLALMRYVFDRQDAVYDRVGPALLGVFPFLTMFLVTSVAMLRERTTGTLERLLTTPMHRADLLVGYGLAFGALALVQAGLAAGLVLGGFGVPVAGPAGLVVVLAVLDALLGTALGLLVSAFAHSEFQAVQFLPAVVLPQFLLCGLLVDVDAMADVLRWASAALPLTYAVDGMLRLTSLSGVSGRLVVDLVVTAGAALVALALAARTLPRRTA